MSNLEHSLNVILPTYNNEFPSELLNLSAGLLAQSHSRAPALKKEEEIARPYACAEIACKRLKAKLRLPALQSRPPCPPRVYKKLCTYLEQTLPTKLPPKRAAATALEQDAPGTSSNPTGATPKKARLADSTTTTPTKGKATVATTPKRALFAGRIAEKDDGLETANGDAPSHIMPLIRRLCAAFSTSLPAPHVYTGACIVLPLSDLHPSKPPSSKQAYLRNTTALTIALFFMVLAKMQRGSIDSETHLKRTDLAIETANLGPDSLSSIDIDGWLTKIAEQGWAKGMEWWDNVPDDVIAEDEINIDAAIIIDGVADTDDDIPIATTTTLKARGGRLLKALDDEDENEDAETVLLPGLGTMMQDRVDWLSEERRADFLDWKQEMMSKIRSLEVSGRNWRRSLVPT